MQHAEGYDNKAGQTWKPCRGVYQSARAARKKCHRLGTLNNRNSYSCSSGSEKSKIKVLGEFCFWWGFSSWLAEDCLLTIFTWQRKGAHPGLSSSSYKGTSPAMLEPHSQDLFEFYCLIISPTSKYGNIRVRVSTNEFCGHIFQFISRHLRQMDIIGNSNLEAVFSIRTVRTFLHSWARMGARNWMMTMDDIQNVKQSEATLGAVRSKFRSHQHVHPWWWV